MSSDLLAHLALAFLLLSNCCLGTSDDIPNDQRIFREVRRNEIYCEDNVPPHECEGHGGADDCYLAEVKNNIPAFDDSSIIRSDDWQRMKQSLQTLARESLLRDSYPAVFNDSIIEPLSGMRDRYCPVDYRLDITRNRFPQLIVHADCLHSNGCLGQAHNCVCKAVMQYRQVYMRLPLGCRLATEETGVGSTALFVKAFVNVTVNCIPIKFVD